MPLIHAAQGLHALHTPQGLNTQRVAQGLRAWSKCQHPNVHCLLGLVEFRDQIGAVSYWMENGDLPLYLRGHPEANRCILVCLWVVLQCCKSDMDIYLFLEHLHMQRSGVLA